MQLRLRKNDLKIARCVCLMPSLILCISNDLDLPKLYLRRWEDHHMIHETCSKRTLTRLLLIYLNLLTNNS